MFIISLTFCAGLFLGCAEKGVDTLPTFDPCDPSNPVVLNGDTIPDSCITRDSLGCVIEIDLHAMDISDPNCINGVEIYGSTLEYLGLHSNQLTSIDLSPLASCANLRGVDLWDNQLTSIDLSPLWELDSLGHLYLHENDLDSASCAHVCDFIDDPPDCHVCTDCVCP